MAQSASLVSLIEDPDIAGPRADEADAERAAALFDLVGQAHRVSSERDDTFLLGDATATRHVIKIANPADSEEALRFRLTALRTAGREAGTRVPTVLATRHGDLIGRLSMVSGGTRCVSVTTFLAGVPLVEVQRSVAQAYTLGIAIGHLQQGLARFSGEVPPLRLAWDLTHVPALRPLLAFVDGTHRELVSEALDEFACRVEPRQSLLPAQVIHNDLNPSNILVRADAPDEIAGIIDFGDLVHAPRINDLAIALSYMVGRAEGWTMKAATLRGFTTVASLTEVEVDLLPSLIKGRLAASVLIPTWRASRRPESASYLLRHRPGALAGLAALAARPAGEVASLLADAAGTRHR